LNRLLKKFLNLMTNFHPAENSNSSHLISMVGPGQNEDPVGRVGDVLVVEPDAHTVLSRLLKNII
jgi:hypothetical protein